MFQVVSKEKPALDIIGSDLLFGKLCRASIDFEKVSMVG